MKEVLLVQLKDRDAQIRELRRALKAAQADALGWAAEVARLIDGLEKYYNLAEDYRRGTCIGTIPGTVICCGEGENFCSSACMLHAKLKASTLAANEWAKAYEDLKNAVCKDGKKQQKKKRPSRRSLPVAKRKKSRG